MNATTGRKRGDTQASGIVDSELTDDLWERVESLIPVRERPTTKEYVRKPGAGRPPKPARRVTRSGRICAAHRLPVEGPSQTALRQSASAAHKCFLEWEAAGVFEAIWKAGLAECDQMQGISWRWRSIDGAPFKAPAGHAGGRHYLQISF